MEQAEVIARAIRLLAANQKMEAGCVLAANAPFQPVIREKRRYSKTEKLQIFKRDGFIDRYSGEKLLHPGILRIISFYFPEIVPFHPHGKQEECHMAHWLLMPSIDHIVLIARGGMDKKENWVTTSMKRNLVKNNWTLEELEWSLYPPGDIAAWDGLSMLYLELMEKEEQLKTQTGIKE